MAWKPADRRAPWAWAEDHYKVAVSPFPGKWRSDNSPWVKKFMETFADNKVRAISVMCSAQSAKTETMLGLLNWLVAEDPGPTMWVTANEDEALKFAKERMMPSLKACEPVSKLIPNDRGLAKSKEIFFPHMTLEIVGSNAPSKLQSKPRRWLLLDEVRNWPPGALPMVLKRCRTFWNARQVVISTPGDEHDAVHQEYLKGNQQVWKVPCPKCGTHHQLLWGEEYSESGEGLFMKWATNEDTKPGGRYDFDKLAPTIHLECSTCNHKIYDMPRERRLLATNGNWVETKPEAPANRKSFTWNAILPTWVAWRDLVEEFISAKKALSWGDPEPLKTFITESLGQPWEDRLKYNKSAKWENDRKGSYKLRDAWPGEKRRFLGVDVQKDCLYYVCRAFGDHGASRLMDYGRLPGFSELRELIPELGVEDDDVIVDSGYNATSIYDEVTKSGYTWKPMKGDDFEYFNVEGVRQVWKDTLIDPALGTSMQGMVKPVRLFVFSNPSIKDLLAEYRQGLGPPWQLPENLTTDYIDQMNAERREEITDTHGRIRYVWVNKPRRPNHYWDCECMIMTGALITNTVGVM